MKYLRKLLRFAKKNALLVLMAILFGLCVTGKLKVYVAIAKAKLGLDGDRSPANQ